MPIIDGLSTSKILKQDVYDTMAMMTILIAVGRYGLQMKQQILNYGFADDDEQQLKIRDIEEIITRYPQ